MSPLQLLRVLQTALRALVDDSAVQVFAAESVVLAVSGEDVRLDELMFPAAVLSLGGEEPHAEHPTLLRLTCSVTLFIMHENGPHSEDALDELETLVRRVRETLSSRTLVNGVRFFAAAVSRPGPTLTNGPQFICSRQVVWRAELTAEEL